MPQRLLSLQAILPWIFMQGPPGQTLFQPSQGGMALNGGLHGNLPSTVNVGAFSAWGGGTNVTALSGPLQQRSNQCGQFNEQALSGGAATLGTVAEEGGSRQQGGAAGTDVEGQGEGGGGGEGEAGAALSLHQAASSIQGV